MFSQQPNYPSQLYYLCEKINPANDQATEDFYNCQDDIIAHARGLEIGAADNHTFETEK